MAFFVVVVVVSGGVLLSCSTARVLSQSVAVWSPSLRPLSWFSERSLVHSVIFVFQVESGWADEWDGFE